MMTIATISQQSSLHIMNFIHCQIIVNVIIGFEQSIQTSIIIGLP